jgi:hypothetical protein
VANTLFLITWFKACIDIENIHPLEGGYLRMKYRRDRRSGLPLEPAWLFYPRFWWESAAKQVRLLRLYLTLRRIYLRIKYDPRRFEYMDLALTPVADDEVETRELFRSQAAQSYVGQEQHLDKLRRGGSAAPVAAE